MTPKGIAESASADSILAVFEDARHPVVVGPAGDVIERATLLKQVQDQGFADAYLVKN